MEKTISICGNRCDLCPLYQGNFGKHSIEELDRGFFKYHEFHVGPDDLGCAGCKAEGKQIRGDCAIRECCKSRSHDNCAQCPEMFCGHLKADIKAVEDALGRFEEIPPEDYEIYFKPYEVIKSLNEIKESMEK